MSPDLRDYITTPVDDSFSADVIESRDLLSVPEGVVSALGPVVYHSTNTPEKIEKGAGAGVPFGKAGLDSHEALPLYSELSDKSRRALAKKYDTAPGFDYKFAQHYDRWSFDVRDLIQKEHAKDWFLIWVASKKGAVNWGGRALFEIRLEAFLEKEGPWGFAYPDNSIYNGYGIVLDMQIPKKYVKRVV